MAKRKTAYAMMPYKAASRPAICLLPWLYANNWPSRNSGAEAVVFDLASETNLLALAGLLKTDRGRYRGWLLGNGSTASWKIDAATLMQRRRRPSSGVIWIETALGIFFADDRTL